MNKINLGLLAILGMIFIISCDDPEPMDTCDTTDMTYTDDIKTILDASCAFAGCHSADEAGTQGSLATYIDAAAFGAFGRLLGAINHDETYKPMPYPAGSAKLPQCSIDKITAWANAGFPQ